MSELLEQYEKYGLEMDLTITQFISNIYTPGYNTGNQLQDFTVDELINEIEYHIKQGGNKEWVYILNDVLLQQRFKKIDKIKTRICLK